MGELRQLRKLELTWNKLSQLPPDFANLTQLQELNLRANRFRKLPDCISRLPAALAHLTQLEQLDLDHNTDMDALREQRQNLLPQLD